MAHASKSGNFIIPSPPASLWLLTGHDAKYGKNVFLSCLCDPLSSRLTWWVS
ncbi:hypothetical protein SACS_0714 [Parasaccharibacter apium]|uniref:Uncharacterized protein n=1 Tax=Parasaccharibacter apium TaxID=1510841 RepID=A0A7U7G5D9_9PROT|nr:hypothetical protein SACS_0714 [Parasaccharibacter apium]